MKLCPVCGDAFSTQRPAQAKWCSSTCRSEAHKQGHPAVGVDDGIETPVKRSKPLQRPTRKALALALLRASGDAGVSTAEFMRAGVGSRYGARLKELRDEGHHIITTYERQGSHRYFLLTAEPSTSQPNEVPLEESEAAGAGRQHGVGGSLFETEPVNAAVADWEAA